MQWKRWAVAGFLTVLAAGAGIVWLALFHWEREQLTVAVLDVGQGDAIFIEAPGGNQVLIDGGPDKNVLQELGKVMPFYDRSIDLVILTHPHADHLDGLMDVLKRYTVGAVMETGVNHSIPEYVGWNKLLEESHIPVWIAREGERVRLSDRTYLDILAPFKNFEGVSLKNIHDSMIVSRLVYASTSVLLMGDAERPLESQLMASGAVLDSDIVKIGHHGSKTSSGENFLKRVSPAVALISVGARNRYGHPHQTVLDRLRALGIPILRTDIDGAIIFESDGVTWWR